MCADEWAIISVKPSEAVERGCLRRRLDRGLLLRRPQGRTGITGRYVAQGALFYGFRFDEHVPADHLLRRIDGVLDFGCVREALAASYSTTGRPSFDDRCRDSYWLRVAWL